MSVDSLPPHSQCRGRPFETQIGVGKVIKGWEEGGTSWIDSGCYTDISPGVPLLSLGEKAILNITPDYVRVLVVISGLCPDELQGYGARGWPPGIPPDSALKFELELLKINDEPR